MHLQELAGNERKRGGVGALERQMAHGRGEHVARGEAEGEMVHRYFWQQIRQQASPLY
jgi:hypothetical protein